MRNYIQLIICFLGTICVLNYVQASPQEGVYRVRMQESQIIVSVDGEGGYKIPIYDIAIYEFNTQMRLSKLVIFASSKFNSYKECNKITEFVLGKIQCGFVYSTRERLVKGKKYKLRINGIFDREMDSVCFVVHNFNENIFSFDQCSIL
jgi:hypothetical protein